MPEKYALSDRFTEDGEVTSFQRSNIGTGFPMDLSHLRSVRLFLLPLLLVALSACSRTVQWEEEVPLNTGEVIWVKRELTYKLQGDAGNPLDIAYRPDRTERISFAWKGMQYRYVGDAQIMLLAISPHTLRPVLIAQAANKDWHWSHNYRCTTPFYVQFVPSANGNDWSWPASIEPWLFDMPYNLMLHHFELGETRGRYSIKDRTDADETIRHQSPHLMRIDPNFKSNSCIK